MHKTSLILTASLALALPALQAAPVFQTGQAASSVLGQSSFTTKTNTQLDAPRGLAVDPITGKLFVADYNNYRILRYTSAAAYTSGAAPEFAFGQPDLTTKAATTAGSTNVHAYGLAFDTTGRLFVADTAFSRVLRFDNAANITTSDPVASALFGQTDTTTGSGAIAQNRLKQPCAVTYGAGYLWIADTDNNRIVAYSAADVADSGTGKAASRVFGQADFTSASAPASCTAATLNAPEGVAIDSAGTLWVADTYNNRVLRFKNAVTKGMGIGSAATADLVLGQGIGGTAFNNKTDYSSAPTAATLYRPKHIVIDESGATRSLWVVDGNRRVLRFDNIDADTFVNGAAATLVLGQPNVSSNTYSTTQAGMYTPYGIAIDTHSAASVTPKTIWVSDTDNNRVTRYTPAEPTVAQPAAPFVIAPAKLKTTKKSILVRGSAGGGATIVKVTANGKTVGAAQWSFRAKLKNGKNSYKIIATDSLGRNSAPKIVTIIRKKK